MPNDDLPPLPESVHLYHDAVAGRSELLYTADQMREYARAALQTRIKADEALMRQALELINFYIPAVAVRKRHLPAIAALHERLGEKP